MFKFEKTCILVIIIGILFSKYAKADTISINVLIDEAKQMDNKEVTIEGEAIGEQMNRGKYAWVNVNDGSNAIGVWLKKEDADTITHYGNYDYIGDKVKIVGLFHRACSEHGGEADIHCQTIQIMKGGFQKNNSISKEKLKVAIILSAITIVVLFWLPRVINRTIMRKYV